VLVGDVLFEGELGLREADLRAAVVQAEGQPLYEDRVFRSVYRVQDLYRERGYLDASVRVSVESSPRDKTATVTFRVASGEPAAIGSVAFDGDLGPFRPSELLAPLRGRPGERYRASLGRQDAERLERWLLAASHRAALVREPEVAYHPGERQVDLTYGLEVGPHFTFEVVGADLEALIKAGPLARLVEERYDEAQGFAATEAVQAHLQAQGHYEAQVELADERVEGERTVRLTVEPGPLFEFASLEIDGNEAASDERLRALLRTTRRRGLGGGGGRLVDAWLAEDLANLRSFYALEGYSDATVGAPEIEISGGEIALRLFIREGQRRTVAALEIEGAVEVAPATLVAGLPLAAGGPYHPNLLAAALDEVRARYEERGYNAVRVDSQVDWNDDGTQATVRLTVLEGPRSLVDRVIVRGYQHTDPELIRIASHLEAGEAVSRQRLLEARRALYRLGIFSEVDVDLVPSAPYAAGRDVRIRVTEGRRRRLSYGAGVDSEDGVRGLLGYSHGNLLGRAIYARGDLLASARDRQARLLVEQPYVWRHELPMTYSLFGLEESRESFDALRYGAQVGMERVRRRWRLGLLGSWEWVELDLLESIEPLDVNRRLQDARIASLTPSVLVDHRDDPVEPTAGWSSNVLLEVAVPVLSAEADFVKPFGQQTAYWGLGRWGVLAATLRLGGIEPGGDEGALVPLSERFFAGGSASHRAYELDTLGIVGETLLLCPSEGAVDPDTGDPATCEDDLAPGDPGRLLPVGGNGLLLLNLDYRFPIVGAFGGTVFLDAGNVWADWRDVDPGEAKLGVGAGVRYRSPVGPVRVEVAWKLDREPLEDPYEVFLSFGYPF
jgi:outer membrane protein insertion porin family